MSLSPSGFLFLQTKCHLYFGFNRGQTGRHQQEWGGEGVSVIEFYINGFMSEIKATCVRGLDLCFVKPQALTHHFGECTVNSVFMCR